MRIQVAVILACLACAMAFPALSANLKLTPAQEAKANEIGAVASPVAFLSAWNEMTRELSAEEAKELEAAPAADKESYAVLRAIGTQLCSGMITAVAQTIAADPNYKGPGNQRICLDPRQSVDGILFKMYELAEQDPQTFHSPQVTTTAFIISALQRLSDCPPS